jgi:hypothetical protein
VGVVNKSDVIPRDALRSSNADRSRQDRILAALAKNDFPPQPSTKCRAVKSYHLSSSCAKDPAAWWRDHVNHIYAPPDPTLGLGQRLMSQDPREQRRQVAMSPLLQTNITVPRGRSVARCLVEW